MYSQRLGRGTFSFVFFFTHELVDSWVMSIRPAASSRRMVNDGCPSGPCSIMKLFPSSFFSWPSAPSSSFSSPSAAAFSAASEQALEVNATNTKRSQLTLPYAWVAHLLLLLRIAVSVAECLSGESFLARTAPGHGCGAMLLEVANKPTSKRWHRETPLKLSDSSFIS